MGVAQDACQEGVPRGLVRLEVGASQAGEREVGGLGAGQERRDAEEDHQQDDVEDQPFHGSAEVVEPGRDRMRAARAVEEAEAFVAGPDLADPAHGRAGPFRHPAGQLGRVVRRRR